LDAVKVKLYVPPVPGSGVPLKMPVASLKVTPLGKSPFPVKVGVGVPDAVTVKVELVPTVNVVLLALVKAGACFWLCVPESSEGLELDEQSPDW